MTFGFYRSQVLGALFSILLIWLLTGVLVYLAVMRVITRDFKIEPVAMVITASCGVIFNIIMFSILHTDRCFGHLEHHGHSHSHSNSDSSRSSQLNDKPKLTNSISEHVTVDFSPSEKVKEIYDNDHHQLGKKKEKAPKNINLRAAAIHVIGDFIQSVGVLIAALIIYFKVCLVFLLLKFLMILFKFITSFFDL